VGLFFDVKKLGKKENQMEAMAPPTHMLPGESPEEVVARLVAYVEYEQRQIDQHPVYGMPPNHYQPGAPEQVASPVPYEPLQCDTTYSTMERVLLGLRNLDTENDPIASRRPDVTMVNPVSGVPTDWGYDGHSLVRPYIEEPVTRPFRAVSAPVPVVPGGFPQHRGNLFATETVPDLPPIQEAEQLPRRARRQVAEAEETDEVVNPRWLRDEELDKKFAKFMGAWEEADAEESLKGRHRRETRFERISKRIGLGIGVIAASSAVIYAGIELLSRK
jgi:hypothetical protein